MKSSELVKQIYLMYKSKMYKLAYYYLKDDSLAEDMVHDAMIKISQKVENGEINSTDGIATLVSFIVKGTCIDFIRHNSRTMYREIYDNEIAISDNHINSEQDAMDILSVLPEKYYEVMQLKFIKDLSYQEISLQIGKSEASIRKIVERAKKMLKKSLEEGGGKSEKACVR